MTWGFRAQPRVLATDAISRQGACCYIFAKAIYLACIFFLMCGAYDLSNLGLAFEAQTALYAKRGKTEENNVKIFKYLPFPKNIIISLIGP